MKIQQRWVILPAFAAMGALLGFVQRPGELQRPDSPAIGDTAAITPAEAKHDGFRTTTPVKLEVADTAQAIQQASLFTSRLRRRYEIGRIAEQFATDDFAALLSSTIAIPDSLPFEATRLLVEIWTEKDPEAAAAFAATHQQSWNLRKSVARGWARKDPTAALAWMMTISTRDRSELFNDLLEGCFESTTPNPEAIARVALQSFEEIDSFYGPRFRGKFFSRWAQYDPHTAEAFARSLPNEQQKQEALEKVFHSVAETNPQDAIRLLESISFQNPARRQWAITSLTSHLADTDITLARKFAESQPEGVDRAQALGSVAKALLTSNPEEAFALVDSIPLEDSGGLDYFYSEVAESDPATALRHCAQRLDRMEPGSGEYKALLQTFEFSLITQSGKYRHPTEVGAFLASDTNDERQSKLSSLLQTWMVQNSAAAIEWTDNLPSGRAREYALTGVAEGRAHKSIPETIQWLNTLPRGNEYAAAVQGFAAAAFNHDPDGALAWIRSIPDPAARQQRLLGAWTRWAESSGGVPTSRLDAERWRDTSPELTPEERQILVLPKRD